MLATSGDRSPGVLAEATGLTGIDLDCGVRMGWPKIEVPESED